jgi:hypothetical protein
MSLYSTAQAEGLIEVLDAIAPDMHQSMPEIVLYSEPPTQEMVMEMHDPETQHGLEVAEPGQVEIVIDDLPGVEALDPELEHKLEVSDEPADSEKVDDNAAKKAPTKWDWASKGTHGFIAWIKERCTDVPKHSGYDTAGIERAISYLDKLDGEISKAMRMDLDGELDANKIEEVRAKIDDGITRLHDRLDKVKKKGKKKKKAEFDAELIKEAQKATNIAGIVITVDLLISRIARVCINGMVSGGHDIEDMFKRQADKYKLTDREQVEVMQLLADMGYPLRQDRGFLLDEDVNTTHADNFDWNANWQA